jgi:CPA1 family monovalent cation:H+ antiporter
MPDGGAFPERDIIMFVASGVILLSLTMTSIVMPFISPKKVDEHKQEDEINAMITIFRSVINELLENAHPDDMPITNEVIRQYDERIRRLQTTKTLEDSEELQLRAQIASWERQNTLDLIAEGRVGIWLGMFYLNSLSRQLARLEHHSTLWESLRALGDQLVLLYRRWRLILRLRQQNPDYGKPESRLQLRGLQIENLNFVLRRLEALQQELDEMQGETPISTHLVGHFVFDTNQQLSQSRRRFRSRMRMLTASADIHAELERQELRLTMRALQWERDAINDALRADQISRSTAKEMFDSVAAMELDIEGFIE